MEKKIELTPHEEELALQIAAQFSEAMREFKSGKRESRPHIDEFIRGVDESKIRDKIRQVAGLDWLITLIDDITKRNE